MQSVNLHLGHRQVPYVVNYVKAAQVSKQLSNMCKIFQAFWKMSTCNFLDWCKRVVQFKV